MDLEKRANIIKEHMNSLNLKKENLLIVKYLPFGIGGGINEVEVIGRLNQKVESDLCIISEREFFKGHPIKNRKSSIIGYGSVLSVEIFSIEGIKYKFDKDGNLI